MRSGSGIVEFPKLHQRGASRDSSLRLTQSATKYVKAQQRHAEEHVHGVYVPDGKSDVHCQFPVVELMMLMLSVFFWFGVV